MSAERVAVVGDPPCRHLTSSRSSTRSYTDRRALSALEEPRNRRPLKRAPAEHPELRDSVEKLYASATPRVRALALAISDSAELASRAIRDEDAGIRERATEVLVKAGDATLLTDERPSVRVRILRRPRWLVTQRRSSWSSVRRNRAS